ncbi:DUF4943 family protein [uncultured Bacteroides sp.]|uniref:DUF4943 family protein n=1 Tax=uncultured Bacteroides sp. TaxID=162156 RepID=UPI002AAC0041|nr:DUF4943 family protein [uncultured Bacteroides sp.]
MKNYIWSLLVGILLFTSCNGEDVDFNNPDPVAFVEQIKAGTYDTKSPYGFVEVPIFAKKDIPELITHVKDMSTIPFFPANMVTSYGPNANYRLGECIMWTIESIRVGRYASLGCKLIHTDVNEHMQYAFLSDKEVKGVADLYVKWWNKVMNQPEYSLKDSFLEDPLAGTNYRWN